MVARVTDRLRAKMLGKIARADIAAFYETLARGGASYSLIKRCQQTISSALSTAVQHGLIAANPALGVRPTKGAGTEDKAEMWPFLASDVEAMYEAQSAISRYADVPVFAFHTGGRSGEIRALRVRDLIEGPFAAVIFSRSVPDSGGRQMRNTTKNGKGRAVPLDARAVEIAKRWAEGKEPDALLFATSTGSTLAHRALLHHLHWTAERGHEATSGGRRFHDLRHGAAVRRLQAGIDPKTVQAWLGRASAAMTLDRYAHYLGRNADLAAMKKLEATDHPAVTPKRGRKAGGISGA
jgi:integrase